jgi:hypothetical protein
MDRSNSYNASTGSMSGSSAPFAYQTRLLERTSSRSGAGPLSRSNSQSNINLLTNTTGSSVGSVTPRKWTPVHRVGNSLDLVRGKWEERSREPEAMLDDTPSSSPTKDMSRSKITDLACYGNDLHCIRSTCFGRPTPYFNEPHFRDWDNKYTEVPQEANYACSYSSIAFVPQQYGDIS